MRGALADRSDVTVWGESCERAFLFVHGMGGSRADAEMFAQRATRHGWQTVSVDLPPALLPWECVPFLQDAVAMMREQWPTIGLHATSIGAWFSTRALGGQPLAGALLQSPVLDMVGMIEQMMASAGVTRDELESAGEISAAEGTVLSWRYLRWAEQHRFEAWDAPTSIIVGENDELIPRICVDEFARKFGADVRTVPGGAHWLHLPHELDAVARWEDGSLSREDELDDAFSQVPAIGVAGPRADGRAAT